MWRLVEKALPEMHWGLQVQKEGKVAVGELQMINEL